MKDLIMVALFLMALGNKVYQNKEFLKKLTFMKKAFISVAFLIVLGLSVAAIHYGGVWLASLCRFNAVQVIVQFIWIVVVVVLARLLLRAVLFLIKR
ncbi:hypothetical protein [Priestia koreensis]|uniref:hypothetical protein n=1 Tax=Priestia koreensis TaxID=284581 RepID=UPI002040030F|nr:hypothetical protein [Priestia koreensis]MCM3005138.1 hypothetical protein [Priestia koreensis]